MKKGGKLVVKSNRLIEAGYRLSLVEQRIILLAIAEARRTGKGINGEDFVRITAKAYARQFETDENSAYLQIKEARRSLFSRQFVVYQADLESGHKEVLEARWLSAASYIDGAGAIRLQFSQAIVPYITRLESEFTHYRLEKVAKMSSIYAIRLYELLMQWGSVGRREIELGWLRQMLQLTDQYPSIKDFKKWVIDVALAQINEHSDLTARYEQRKTGRNVTHLTFTFAPKEAAPPPKAPEAPADARESPALARLRGLGIPARLAAAWVRQDEGRALAAAEYVEARVARGEVKGRAAGYLREVFESGGEIGESAFEAGAKARASEAAERAGRAEAEQRAKKKADGEAEARARRAVAALPPEVLRVFAAEYRAGAGAALESWDDGRGDFRNTVERLQFKSWLVGRFKGSGAGA